MVELRNVRKDEEVENPDDTESIGEVVYVQREHLILEHRGLSDWEYEAA